MVSMSKCVWQKSVLHLMSKGGHVVYGLESLKRISERDLEQWTSANIWRASNVSLCSFSWLSNIPLHICTISPLSIPVLMDI